MIKRSILLFCMVIFLTSPVSAQASERPRYIVRFAATLSADTSIASVTIRVTKNADWVNWMLLRIDPTRYREFKGSGNIETRNGDIYWAPPDSNAWLSFDVDLLSKRSNGRYDGYRGDDWLLFRLDDLVPQIRIDMKDGTESYSTLELDLPENWSAALPYKQFRNGRYSLDNQRSLFDRPSGWMLTGESLGIRREVIAETAVTVAAPTGQNFARMQALSFLYRNLPSIRTLLPMFPDRLLIVGADDPMWRGALSGPRSLFLHSDRPLISEDSTSTLIHELIHVGMQARGEADADWLVEGLAEYYALSLLARSGDLPDTRIEAAFSALAKSADHARPLTSGRSYGRITARAVTKLRAIDREIREGSSGKFSLDDVVRELALRDARVSNLAFAELVETFAGHPSATLARILSESVEP